MKLKYYLRGFGTGILFATLILFFSYSYNYSNAKIKEKAKELGMVETSVESDTSLGLEASSNNDDSTTAENMDEASKDSTTNNDETTEEDTSNETQPVETTTPETTTEEITTQETTTQEVPSTNNPDSNTQYEFTISRGMDSSAVAALLKRAGVIEDAQDFDNYLVNNGYAERIIVGNFRINAGASYNDIANLITNG